SSYLSEEEKVECVWMYVEKISDCEIIDNRAHFQKEYESCLSQGAINEGKATVCMDLSDKERQNNCVTQVALKHDNPDACERLDFPLAAKEDCFVAYALAKNDAKVCKRLVDLDTRKECEEATA
ncbi:hypothetical protein GOV10_02480, partial [Candidatus Woesearchaeota archaeon]|nr:hypothetical protein [Candidatus Woesearchaeota archaeon]